jgi:hypothetical protein
MNPPKTHGSPEGTAASPWGHLLNRYSRLRLLHLADVSTLSGPDHVEPVSAPLQRGIRFFRLPIPAPSSAFLTVCLPPSGVLEESAVNRGFLVPCDAKRVQLNAIRRLGPISPSVVSWRRIPDSHGNTNHIPFWIRP